MTGGTVTSVTYAVDDTPSGFLLSAYLIDTGWWQKGTHVIRVWAFNNATLEATGTFVVFIDPTAVWPPDTAPMDIVLVGFDVNASAVADALISRYIAPVPLTPGATTYYNFDLRFPFTVRSAPAAYHQTLLAARGPIDLRPEFEAFYGDYDAFDLRSAYVSMNQIEAQLTETVPPTADAGSDRTAQAGVAIALDGNGSSDNYRAMNYSWDFGDGTPAWGWSPTINHSWTVGGAYTVTLSVSDAAGNRGSDSLIITVVGPSPPPPPTDWALVAGVGIAAAAAVALLVVLRLRKGPPAPPSA